MSRRHRGAAGGRICSDTVTGCDERHAERTRCSDRHRSAARFLPRRRARGAGRRRGHAGDQPPRAPFRACRHHAGLAPAGAYVLRERPSRPKALRDDRGGLRPADLVAGSLRAEHIGRGVPSGARRPACRIGDPQGLSPRDSIPIRRFARTTGKRRPGLPVICASAASRA